MPGLVPGIDVLKAQRLKDVDGRAFASRRGRDEPYGDEVRHRAE
jgi:hypothetical protein